ncbi:MAG: glycosyltransferase WbuB [Odoribacter sp.]|nr:glycosyltransferase WbuB [Odoribacter sp.]
MKLLLIVDDYLPHSIKVAAKMMHEMALEFETQGHEVTVLTPSPSLSTSFEERSIEGIKVLFFKSGEIKNISKIKRAINESLLSFFAWRATHNYLKTHPHDAIIYYSPSIFWGYLVGKLKKLWGVKSYLILRDIFPQWTVDNELMKKNSPVYIYFKFFEHINYKNADCIGVMSPSNLEFFKATRKNTEKFEVLYNWAKIGTNPLSTDTFRKQLNLEDKIVFFYGGNIGHAQNMMNLVRLAIKLKENSNAHFLFVGKGDEVDLILTEKEKHQLKNITYLPSVDQETYFNMLSEFDIGLFSLHPGHKTHNFPGKLLGYMEYSKPILGSVNVGNDLKEIINKAEAGFIYDNGEDEALYEAALSLIESEKLRNNIGENARKLLIEKFSVEQACTQILNRFEQAE